MDQDFVTFLFLNKTVDLLTNHKNLFVGCNLKILPVRVEVRDACIVDDLWVIRKPDFVTDKAVPTNGVFARLLQIEHRDHVQSFQLLDQVPLFNLPVTQSRARNNYS
jgi:hypothetical protein